MTTQAGPLEPVFTTADRFRKARELAELSQEKLAEEIGVSPRTISRYETGAIDRPRKIVTRQWALRCNVSYDWLSGTFPDPGDDAAGGALSPRYQHMGHDLLLSAA